RSSNCRSGSRPASEMSGASDTSIWMGNGSKKSGSNSAAGMILIGYSQGTERGRATLQIRRGWGAQIPEPPRGGGRRRSPGCCSLEVMPMSDVTHILSAIEQGDPHAAEQLLPLVYAELRHLAALKLAQEKPGQTLQPTALVHEAYLRLVGNGQEPHWDSR